MRNTLLTLLLLVVGILSCSGPTEPTAVATVTVNPSSITLASGATTTLTAATLDAKGVALTGRVITWSSSNESIATVNPGGVVTAGINHAGIPARVNITATSEGQSATAAMEVTPLPVQRIVITQDSVMIRSGSSFQLQTTVYGQGNIILTGREVRWVTLDSSIARITSAGLVSIEANDGARYRTTHGIAISGGASDSAIIVAQPLVPTLQLTITDTIARVGKSTQANWSSLRSHTCEIAGITTGTVSVTGQSVISPTSGGRRFVKITCTGDGGSKSDSVIVITPHPVLPTSYENYRDYVIPAVSSPFNVVPRCTRSNMDPANARAYADFLQDGTLIMADYVGGAMCFWRRSVAGQWIDISSTLIDNPSNEACPGDANKGVVADYNGDLIPDVLFVCYRQESFFLLSQANGKYRTQRLGKTSWTHGAAAGDIDGDGDVDILFPNDQWASRGVASDVQAFITVFLNDGSASFTQRNDLVKLPDDPEYWMGSFTALELIDLDNDGVLDAVLANGQYPTTIFWGEARKGFTQARPHTRLPWHEPEIPTNGAHAFHKVGNYLYAWGIWHNDGVGNWLQRVDLTSWQMETVWTRYEGYNFLWAGRTFNRSFGQVRYYQNKFILDFLPEIRIYP